MKRKFPKWKPPEMSNYEVEELIREAVEELKWMARRVVANGPHSTEIQDLKNLRRFCAFFAGAEK